MERNRSPLLLPYMPGSIQNSWRMKTAYSKCVDKFYPSSLSFKMSQYSYKPYYLSKVKKTQIWMDHSRFSVYMSNISVLSLSLSWPKYFSFITVLAYVFVIMRLTNTQKGWRGKTVPEPGHNTESLTESIL